MRRLLAFVRRHTLPLVALYSLVVAAVATTYVYVHGTTLAYGDAESHVNIAKRVVGGLTPGFGQLGGVWLPLHHLLMAPFMLSDFLWRSGLGGAFVSAAAFVAASVFVYRLGHVLGGRKWLGLLALAVFSLNPNILYMLATPMSELPLLAFMMGSTYFFVRWLGDRQLYSLVLAGGLVLLGSLIRYDAWFLAFVELGLVLVTGIRSRWNYKRVEGTMILFATLALFGIVLWCLWCLVIFKDPLYFLHSPFSASAQQESFREAGQLPAYHSLGEAIVYYVADIAVNVGIPLLVTAALGAVAYLVSRKGQLLTRLSVVGLLLSPLIFNILALFLGISILFIPGITPKDYTYQLFNVRYGVATIPAVAILIALLAAELSRLRPRLIFKRTRLIGRVATVAILALVLVFSQTYPVTLLDGTKGLSARHPDGSGGASDIFKGLYDYGYVAFDDYARTADPIDIGVPMNKIIYVGNHPAWDNLLKTPNDYARWLLVRNDGDALSRAFASDASFNTDYTGVYTDGSVTIYRCDFNCVMPSL